ncbi:uncharacterized protein SPSK_10151 [Sporothrix schenckii 1099-18]|uniref:Uncharacterized protein n=1 Tax=Sporothrix schenckii 1099-18 TaxID=1397361 RepID=A0A0F2M9J2_SPOSC|nr:uncharacterized protein SPSK_10151 [Sporothrix schenckii 1099-18]KJR85465.1 hypothetical protein SPSK_10151 [Sporothrix schenckii 1099-18]
MALAANKNWVHQASLLWDDYTSHRYFGGTQVIQQHKRLWKVPLPLYSVKVNTAQSRALQKLRNFTWRSTGWASWEGAPGEVDDGAAAGSD